MKEEKGKYKALHGQYHRVLEKPHINTVITNKWFSSNLKEKQRTFLSLLTGPGNKNQKLPESNIWLASEEQMHIVVEI